MGLNFSAVADRWSSVDPGERAKWAVFIPCVVLVGLHLGLRWHSGKIGEGLDAVALGLAAIGLSPWVAKVVESFKFGGVELKFVRQLAKQDADIRALKFLVLSFVSQYELGHLKKFADKKEFIIDKNHFREDFQRELRHLRDLGLINHYPDQGIRKLYESPEPNPNVLKHFYITDAGLEYLRLRTEMAENKAIADADRRGETAGA